MPECREKLIREMEGQLTRAEVEDIFHRIEHRFFPDKSSKPVEYASEADINAYEERMKSLGTDGRYLEAAKEAFQEAIHEKKEALRRQYVQAERNDWVIKYIQKNGARGNVKALITLMAGDVKGRQDVLTLQGRKNGHLQLDMSEMFDAFDNYMKFFGFKMTDEQALNIARELDQRGSTSDHAAQALADVWERWATRARNRKNELGADIGYLKDWRMPQVWEPGELKRYGLTDGERAQLLNPFTSRANKDALYAKAKQSFIDEAANRADRNRYVDHDGVPLSEADLRTVLSDVFDTITTRGLSEQPMAMGGKKSLAQKLGEHRELHFKSAEDWFYFNKRAGKFDVLGIMQQAIMANARDTALLEVFGPNPESAFRTALAWAEHWDSGIPSEKTSRGAEWAKHIFAELAAANHYPLSEGGEIVSRYFQGLRNWMVSAKMGSVLLSQVNDIATYTAIARTDGLGIGRAIEFAAKSLNPASAEERKIAMQMGVATNTMINEVALRYGEAIKGVSLSSRFANATIKLSGMEYWTDSMKRGYQMLVGFELHNAVQKGLENMPQQFQRMLGRYGIGAKEWDIIRQAAPVEISGEKMLTPVSVKMLSDASEIRETALKVAAMMSEEADIAIVSPGAREMAFFRRSTAPGTLWGEAARSFGLFKTFSVSLSTKVLPRVFGVEGTAGFRAGLAAQFALSMMIAGGISYQLKSISMGRNPRDITSPEFWMAATAQSGGLGIFGDYLFADYNRFGHDVPSAVFGPIGGLTSDIAKLSLGNIQQAMQGKETHIGAEAIQFVKNYTPYINLWYSRAALDHLLFFTVQEAANPGYLRRMRERTKRENEQTFWWDPQDKLPEELPDLSAMTGGK